LDDAQGSTALPCAGASSSAFVYVAVEQRHDKQ